MCNQNFQWEVSSCLPAVLDSWFRQCHWGPSFSLSVLPPLDWPLSQAVHWWLPAIPISPLIEIKSYRVQRFIFCYLRGMGGRQLSSDRFCKGERVLIISEIHKYLLLSWELWLGNMLIPEPIPEINGIRDEYWLKSIRTFSWSWGERTFSLTTWWGIGWMRLAPPGRDCQLKEGIWKLENKLNKCLWCNMK